MTRLYGKSCYLPLFLEISGKEYELDSFIFYNNEGVIFKHEYGYLENSFKPNFDFEIKRKLKVNFTEKSAYIIKSNNSWNVRYDLYIHEDLVGLKEPTYKRKYNMIFALYETDIPNFHFEVYQKSIDEGFDVVRDKIIEESKKLTSYSLTSETLQECINKLITLKDEFKREEKLLSEYTVEDYIKEINK